MFAEHIPVEYLVCKTESYYLGIINQTKKDVEYVVYY